MEKKVRYTFNFPQVKTQGRQSHKIRPERIRRGSRWVDSRHVEGTILKNDVHMSRTLQVEILYRPKIKTKLKMNEFRENLIKRTEITLLDSFFISNLGQINPNFETISTKKVRSQRQKHFSI